MNRKDYIKIANALKSALPSCVGRSNDYDMGQDNLMIDIVDNLCEVFKADNPLFNEDKFLEAVYG